MTRPFKYLLGVLHGLIFAIRFAWRSRQWTPVTERARPVTQDVLVSGFFNETLGIGRAAQLVASGLENAGLSLSREDLRPFDQGLATRPAVSFKVGADAPIWLIAANPPEAKIALFAHNHAAWRDKYRIGLWHWESSLAPAKWIKAAHWFHEIWLSSQFTADAIAAAMHKAGCPEQVDKLRVHPLPVAVPQTLPTPPERDHVQVLAMFDPRSDFERKNPLAVVTAWLSLFPEESQTARLTVKALSGAVNHPRFVALKALTQNRADITVWAETLSMEETETLIADSDILISLHRGEGFGLPLAEAMARGISVVATGWSGNLQFMTQDNSILVPYRLVPATREYNGPQAQWADPDLCSAVDALRRLIDDAPLRARMGRRARADIAVMSADWLIPK